LTSSTHIISARWLLPISAPPIENGWVRLRDQTVVEIGRGQPPGRPADPNRTDLGDAVLLPGLVNAHTHLEFSGLAEPIGAPGVSLPDWIVQVVAKRAGDADHESRRKSIRRGIQELRDSGTRLAADIVTPPCAIESFPEPAGSPIEIIALPEVIGLSPERCAERQAAAINLVDEHRSVGISPHAPYSTRPEAIDWCVATARNRNRPLAMHVAESSDERRLLTHGDGPFADALHTMGVWQNSVFPWSDRPVEDLIKRLASAPRGLIIHGNDLTDREIDLIGRHPNLTVVYCPRTHHFFGYENHPVARLLAAGIRVALGTDSRASDLSPKAVLEMATVAGARALGREKLGQIQPGCQPGFGCVRTSATRIDQVYEHLAMVTCTVHRLNAAENLSSRR